MARSRTAPGAPERPAELDSRVPFPPMEAELVRELPRGPGWQVEPKWDGFRGLLENTSGELALWSRNGRPLLRYFPELRELGDRMPPHSALDGEIVIARDGVLDFDAMQMRLHPAESRIRKLSSEIPATFVAFDILLWEDEEIWQLPLHERRVLLEKHAARFPLSPCAPDTATAESWLHALDVVGLDGLVAKQIDKPYTAGERSAVVKVKPERTADCVVVGVRFKEGTERIATLLLGLYDNNGAMTYVGSAAVGARNHDDVAERVRPLLDPTSGGRVSEPNRWGGSGLEEAAARPELVVEVRFDKVQGNRFRHGTKLIRFRPDKSPSSCTWRELHPAREPDDLTFERLLERPSHARAPKRYV